MEYWKEIFKDMIQEDYYEVKLINGEEYGLIIKFQGKYNAFSVKFGEVKAVRMIDEGIVQTDIYSENEVQKYKKEKFKNMIYEVVGGQFKDEIKRPDRDNAIDVYLSEDFEDVIGDGNWQQLFTEKPQEFPRAEQREYLAGLKGVCLGSDAFFPFGDNIERAAKSGVSYIAQPGGSIRDDNVIETCNKYNMVMAMTGIRLFHH